MAFVDRDGAEWRQNRPGSRIRTVADAAGGAGHLALIEQICEPGVGAPTHWHDFDEVLEVAEGTAEVWIGEARRVVGPGICAFMPAGVRHGFRNVGDGPLRIRGAFSARELATQFVGHEEQTVRADLPIPWEQRASTAGRSADGGEV